MAVVWSVALPAIIVSHVLGLAFLIYGLNRLTNFLTKAWRKLICVQPAPASPGEGDVEHGATEAETDTESADYSKTADLSNAKNFGSTDDAEPKLRPPRWTRECECSGSCHCLNRWVPPESVEVQRGNEGVGKIPRNSSEDSTSMLGKPVAIAVDLAWRHLAISVTDPDTHTVKQILHPSSGIVVPGEMCALVGPSGAGKSTLLDILADYKKTGKVEGKIYMNGSPVGKRFKRLSAYVSQEDVFVPTMSAWETLSFHAALRLGNSLSKQEKLDRMSDVLRIMGLWRSKDTQVGGYLPGGINVRGLSGGEKRRLTISCSLIARPSIIFLDEPTSGLDSFAALNVMEHLSQLAAVGHTIIASIHQPREGIWNMFHKVAVLSEGHQLYFGDPSGAIAWFQDQLGYQYIAERDGAPSDWLIDLVAVGFTKPKEFAERSMSSRDDVIHAAAKWAAWRDKHTEEGAMVQEVFGNDLHGGNVAELDAATHATKNSVVPPRADGNYPSRDEKLTERQYAASWWTQFWLLTQRTAFSQLRNPADVVSRLALSTWVGIVAGLAAYDIPWTFYDSGQRVVVQFFLIVVLMLLPFCYMSIYISDRQFFQADVQAGLYHPSAYYMAQTIGSLPFIVLNTLAGGFATHGLVGLRTGARWISLYAILLILISLCSTQVLVFSVYVMPNMDLAFMLSCFYSSISFVLAGFYYRISLMKLAPMRWLSYTMYPRWVMVGLARVQLQGVQFYFPPGCDIGKPELPKRDVASFGGQAYTPGQCDVAGTGDYILDFLEMRPSAEICVGILFGFYVILHVMSYMALITISYGKR